MPAFVVAASIDHRIWRRLAWPLLGLSLAGLVLVLVPGVGVTGFGSTRWLGFGPLVIQPSEIAKLATLLWLADVLERKRPRDGDLHDRPPADPGAAAARASSPRSCSPSPTSGPRSCSG
jgi:cell division protein FtsW